MELLKHFFDLVLHLDKTLLDVVHDYGAWTYLILFLIIFTETGVVIFPFLPSTSARTASPGTALAGKIPRNDSRNPT